MHMETIQKYFILPGYIQSPGLEGISQTFLALPLCNPVNISYLIKFSFPDQCKIPNLKPLFEKGSFRDQKDHRLICLSLAVSKKMEKTIQIQI